MTTLTIKIPEAQKARLSRLAANVSEFVREAIEEKAQRMEGFNPLTPLARKLWRRRQAHLAAGGETLTAAESRAELARRRGERRNA